MFLKWSFKLYRLKAQVSFSDHLWSFVCLSLFSSRAIGQISTNLSTKHSWVKKIQICSNDRCLTFPRIENNEIAKVHLWNLIKSLKIQFQSKLAYRVSLGDGVSTLIKGSATPFSRLYNNKIVKMQWYNLNIFFSRATGPFLTKLCTKHLGVKWIQVCSNKGPCTLFVRGDNSEIVKIHWCLFLQNHESISTELRTTS